MLSSQQGIACRHVVRFYGVSAMVALTIIGPIALLDGLIQKYLGEAILTFMAFVIMAYREEKYYDPAIATVLFQIALLFVLGTAISCLYIGTLQMSLFLIFSSVSLFVSWFAAIV